MIERLKRLFALSLLGPEFRQQIARRRVVGNTLVIESPKIGFLNLLGVSAHDILQEEGIIRGSNAAMVIFASQNENTDGISGGIRKGPIIVFTLSRTGPGFTSFYKQLFSKMFSGITMPIAWNEIAPQSLQLVDRHIQGYEAFAVRVANVIFKGTEFLTAVLIP